GDALQIILGAGRYTTENNFFGNTPPQQGTNFIIEFFGSHKKPVLQWSLQGISQGCEPAGYNAYFQYRVGMFQLPAYDGMSRFVVGHNFAFPRIDKLVFLLQSRDNPFY